METTNNITTETMIAEFKKLLNSRYTSMKRNAEITGSRVITDPAFFAKVVREYLNDRKINKKYNDWSYRCRVMGKAADAAEYACSAPARCENAAMYSEAFKKCGIN